MAVKRSMDDDMPTGLPVQNMGGIGGKKTEPIRPFVPPTPYSKAKQNRVVRPIGGGPNVQGAPAPRTRPDTVRPPEQQSRYQKTPVRAPISQAASPPPPPSGGPLRWHEEESFRKRLPAPTPPGAVAPGATATPVTPGAPPPPPRTGSWMGGGEVPPGAQGQPQPLERQKVTTVQPDGTKTVVDQPMGMQSPEELQRQQEEQQERLRLTQPSPIQGFRQKTYETITNENNAPAEGTPEQRKQFSGSMEFGLKNYGAYPGSDDPEAPPPPIRPHGNSFNPYSGKFTKEGPDSLKRIGINVEQESQNILGNLGILQQG